jgi:hypothetical protein
MDAGGRAPTVGALGDAGSSCRGAEAFPAIGGAPETPVLAIARTGLFRPTSNQYLNEFAVNIRLLQPHNECAEYG